jgi:hypothetical protein
MREVQERLAELRYVFGGDRTVVQPGDGPAARANPVAILIVRIDDLDSEPP